MSPDPFLSQSWLARSSTVAPDGSETNIMWGVLTLVLEKGKKVSTLGSITGAAQWITCAAGVAKLAPPVPGANGSINKVQILTSGLILDNNNQPYDSVHEALGVSNYVTTDGLPATSKYDDKLGDPKNFRLQAKLPDPKNDTSVTMKLEVVRDVVSGGQKSSQVVWTHDYLLDQQKGDKVRSHYLRLVSDSEDDAISADQTILVKLGDKIRVSHNIATGAQVQQEVQVGRPSNENNNDAANHKKHDIRQVKLVFHVFKNISGDAAVDSDTIKQLVDETNERLAQACIKVSMSEDAQTTNGGIALPGSLRSGFQDAPTYLYHPTDGEDACFAKMDKDQNSIDVVVVPYLTTQGGIGVSYPKIKNKTGDPKYRNLVVISPDAARYPCALPHEIMHILLNSFDRTQPDFALFKIPGTIGKPVNGGKRIGPYPEAISSGIGQGDTKAIRSKAEGLP